MEQNIPVIAKKIWNIMRVAFFMLRKGICKRKILMDLNLMMKRGKIAGKALHNIMFHLNHHHRGSGSNPMEVDDATLPSHLQEFYTNPPREYEFSCSNTPLYRQYFPNNKKSSKKHQKKESFFYMPSPLEDMNNLEAVNNMFDMMMLSGGCDNGVEASPALSVFGRNSPAVRQLRITDSPFPVQNGGASEDAAHVDAAAEEFIKKFYSQLKQQKVSSGDNCAYWKKRGCEKEDGIDPSYMRSVLL